MTTAVSHDLVLEVDDLVGQVAAVVAVAVERRVVGRDSRRALRLIRLCLI